MKFFKYKAATNEGYIVSGVLDAQSKTEVLDYIRSKELLPVYIKQNIKKTTTIKIDKKVNRKLFALFCSRLHMLLKSRINIIQSLDILCDKMKDKKLREALEDVCSQVRKGSLLSEAFSKHENIFPAFFIYMIKAGEISNDMVTATDYISQNYFKENEIYDKLKSVMLYPMILGIMLCIAIGMIVIFAVPNIVSVYDSADLILPDSTQAIVDTSRFFIQFWKQIVLAICITILALKLFLKTNIGRLALDTIKVKMPLIKNITVKLYTYRFASIMNSLICSQVSVIESLTITSKVINNKFYEAKIKQMCHEIGKGESFSAVISHSCLFDDMFVYLIETSEETGEVAEQLTEIIHIFEQELQLILTKYMSYLEVGMLVLMGIIVGGIVFSIVLPLMDLPAAIPWNN